MVFLSQVPTGRIITIYVFPFFMIGFFFFTSICNFFVFFFNDFINFEVIARQYIRILVQAIQSLVRVRWISTSIS